MAPPVKIPVEADFDSGSATKALQDFEKGFNAVGEAIARANKQKFVPIDKASLDNLKKYHEGYQALLKVNTELSRRMKATGQQNSGLFDLDWKKLYPNEGTRARKMREAFSYATQTQLFAPGEGGGSGGGRGGGGPVGRGFGGPVGRWIGNNVVMPAAQAAGMGPLASAAAAGGLAGLAGGLVAQGVGKLIGAVVNKFSAGKEEVIGYDTLKRLLGDVNVSFGELKDKVRLASDGLGVTYNETMKLAQQFSRTAGLAGGQGGGDMPMELRTGIGYSRSFGLDPSQGTDFFAKMRMYGASGSADESRRLGAMIGEGVARSGGFAKMGDVLQAVSSYAQDTARGSFTRANVGGYMQFLSTMMGTGLPGTDAASSASLMARADSSFRSGGSESTQNFLYRAIGSRLGIDPFQTMVMRESGLFGSGSQVFRKDGVYDQFMGDFGGKRKVGASKSGVSNIDMLMEGLTKNFAGMNPELMANALSGMTGLNNTQAMVMASSWKRYGARSVNSLNNRLGRLGLDVTKIDPTAYSNMASIEANGSLSETQKNQQIKDAATAGQIKTEGEKLRDGMTSVENATQRLMDPLLSIAASTAYMAGGGKKSPREIMAEMAKIESRDHVDQINSDFGPRIEAAQHKLNQARKASYFKDNVPAVESAAAEVKALQAAHALALQGESGALQDHLGDIKSGRMGPVSSSDPSRYDDLFARIGKEQGVDPKLLKAIALHESALNPNATHQNDNGTIDVGLMQHNNKYLSERGITDPFDAEQSVRGAAKYLKSLGVDKDRHHALARYNGTGAKAEHYADTVENELSGVTLSDAALARERGGTATAGGANVTHDVTVHVVDRDGAPMAAPVTKNLAVVRKPAAAGSTS